MANPPLHVAPSTSSTEHEHEHEHEHDKRAISPMRGPGCGLAAYAVLLLIIAAVGIIGMVLSTWNLIGGANQVNPMELQSGTDVVDYRLTPLRDAGLLGPDELPMAWHDESPDMTGTVACALTTTAILRVDQDQARHLDFDDMASVESIGGASGQVILAHPKEAAPQASAAQADELGCRFGPREGGNRFLRQIQVELLRRDPTAL